MAGCFASRRQLAAATPRASKVPQKSRRADRCRRRSAITCAQGREAEVMASPQRHKDILVANPQIVGPQEDRAARRAAAGRCGRDRLVRQ